MNNQKDKSEKKFNIGLIGLGNTGSEHLRYYLNNKKIKKIFISDIKKIKTAKNKKIVIDPKLKKFKNLKGKKIVYPRKRETCGFDIDLPEKLPKTKKSACACTCTTPEGGVRSDMSCEKSLIIAGAAT